MNWAEEIDQYCERVGPQFWAEPINALTNASFLIAAALLWRRYKRTFPGPGARQWELEVLIALIATVGVGSFLFHTVATRWAMTADVVPIMLALVWALGVFLRRRMRYGMRGTLAGYGLFFAATAALAQVPAELVNGSQAYFGTAAALFAMGAVRRRSEDPNAWRYLAAGGVFVLSLVCRAVDMRVCDGMPLGTHFLWHTLNGVAFYMCVSALIE
jgi:hypothetical protein